MAQDISMFPTYTQRENRVTNYVGLVLKHLYQENPSAFQRVMARMVDDDVLEVGPSFRQQRRRGRSVPDLLIEQPRFWVNFEVKRTDNFDEDQVRRHVDGMPVPGDGDVSVLVLLGPAPANLEQLVPDLVEESTEDRVQIVSTSFEHLAELLRSESDGMSPQFTQMLDDFDTLLDGEGLIPRWQRLLDVVNSGQLLDEIIDGGAYCCPDTGGAYSHKRARYLGAYKDKTVSLVAQIEGVVVVTSTPNGDLSATVRWENGDASKPALERRAKQFVSSRGIRASEVRDYDLQVFLLGERQPTSFRKSSAGGMLGSKKYFWNIPRSVTSAAELATLLDGREWSEWEEMSER